MALAVADLEKTQFQVCHRCLHMTCFPVIFCHYFHMQINPTSPVILNSDQAVDHDTRRRLLFLVLSDFLGSLFQLLGCSSSKTDSLIMIILSEQEVVIKGITFQEWTHGPEYK